MFFHDMKLLERVLWLKRIKGSGNPMHEATSTSGSFVTDVVAPLKKLLLTLSPIQSGSGDPSPSNPRPISGHTECVTEVCGVNVWDEEWEVGSIYKSNGQKYSVYDSIRSKNYIHVKPNTEYYFCSADVTRHGIFYYDSDKNFIGVTTKDLIRNEVFTTPADCHYILFDMAQSYGATYNHDISINYPSTDHDYHAYNGTSYTTTLGRTVYGGTLDVVSGELVVDRAMVDLGALTWSRYTPGATNIPVFYASVSGMLKANEGASLPLCSSYRCEAWTDLSRREDGTLQPHPTLALIYVADSRFDNADSFASAVQGVQLVYELSTPQTYQLTRQQINSLNGQNNFIAEDGIEVSEVVYMTRLVGSPLLGSPQTEDEPTEETNEEPIVESEEPEGE